MYIIHDETKTLRPLLSQGYRATTRRKFIFYHSFPRSSRFSTDHPQKDERLSWPWSHPGVLNRGQLDCKSSTLTTTSLLHELRAFKKLNICLIKWDFDSFLLWEELQKKVHLNVFLTWKCKEAYDCKIYVVIVMFIVLR